MRIDFIVALLKQLHKCDVVLTITNKKTRKHIFISKKFIWTTQEWVHELLNALQKDDWKISVDIIFDRNFKFVFDLWKIVFKRFEIILLMIIAYHAQTNNMSKRINQTVKIALRYLITKNPNFEWKEILSALQLNLNNNVNVIIDIFSNEVALKFKSREIFTIVINKKLIVESNVTHFFHDKFLFRQKAADITSFATTKIKIKYDDKHKILRFRLDEKIYFRLHHEYRLLFKSNRKLFNQKTDSFTIKKKVDRLTYELKLSLKWKIHFVISVQQLKSASIKTDFFQKSRFDHLEKVEIEKLSNTIYEKNYEIANIVDKRTRKFEKTNVTQWLIE